MKNELGSHSASAASGTTAPVSTEKGELGPHDDPAQPPIDPITKKPVPVPKAAEQTA